jgi:hypothetical protein
MSDKAAEVACHFFEGGAAKRFFEEWEPELRPDDDPKAHYAALVKFAKGTKKARDKYWDATHA